MKITPKKLKLKHTISNIPGDKSISHRAIILGSLATNTATFTNFLTAEDCLNTAKIFEQLGVPITRDNDTITIQGVGLNGLKKPTGTLDVGNSGTGIRLISGVLAAQNFETTISGDSSIQKRPMKRIITPLSEMGAQITGTPLKDNIVPPLTITPSTIIAMNYTLPVASAQVKSAILLASLFSKETTTITEPKPSRNHTEIMLKGFGADIKTEESTISCSGKQSLSAPSHTITIPSDFSSAAFFIVLAAITPDSHWTIKNIGINDTRASLIEVLQAMGANISVENINGQDMEPYADISIKGSPIKNITVPEHLIPIIIDEIPILAIAGLFGSGTLKVTNAKELRVKESDRIQTIVHMVSEMGATITEYEDGFELEGLNGNISPFTVNSHGDHRIAMSAIIAATAAQQEATVENTDCINTSFPNFLEIIACSTQP